MTTEEFYWLDEQSRFEVLWKLKLKYKFIYLSKPKLKELAKLFECFQPDNLKAYLITTNANEKTRVEDEEKILKNNPKLKFWIKNLKEEIACIEQNNII